MGWNDYIKPPREFIFGSKSKMKPYNKTSLSWLENLFNEGQGIEGSQLYGQGSDFLKSLYGNDEAAWRDFEAPMRQQFEQVTAPGIAERFGGMGTGAGALSSSGLNNSLATAGRQLQSDLAQQRGQMRMQGLPQLMEYANAPFKQRMQAAQNMPNQYYEREGKEGMMKELMQIIAQMMAA